MKKVLFRKLTVIFLLTATVVSYSLPSKSKSVSVKEDTYRDTAENKQRRSETRRLNEAWNSASCAQQPQRTKANMEALRNRADRWKGPDNNLTGAFEFFSINYSLANTISSNGRRFLLFPPARFPSPYRNRQTNGQASQVEPDGLSDLRVRTVVRTTDGRRFTVTPTLPNAVFAEAKTTVENLSARSGSGNISGGSYQIGGMIDALSRRRNNQWRRFQNRLALRTRTVIVDAGSTKPRAIFIIVGPSSTGIARTLRTFAARRQIALYKAVLCDTGGTEGVDESQIGFGVLTNPVNSRPDEPQLLPPGLVGSLVEGRGEDGGGGDDGGCVTSFPGGPCISSYEGNIIEETAFRFDEDGSNPRVLQSQNEISAYSSQAVPESPGLDVGTWQGQSWKRSNQTSLEEE